MKTRSFGWTFGKWAALFSIITWVVPPAAFDMVWQTAYAVPQPAAPFVDDEEAIAASFGPLAQAIMDNPELDLPDVTYDLQDLTGDIVPDQIVVRPGGRFLSDGTITVIDGATGAAVYHLSSPPREVGFAHYVGLTADCNSDGTPDLAVVSGVPLDAGVQVLVRIFSGRNGRLLGVIRDAEPELGVAGEVEVAGDVNGDRVVDADDVILSAAAVGSPAECRGDVDVDGEISSADVIMVAVKAIEEQQGISSAAIHAEISVLAVGGEGFVPIAGQAVAGIGWQGGWGCWLKAARLSAQLIILVGTLALCGGSSMAPPAAIACAIAWCCLFAEFLAKLMDFVATCWTSYPLPGGIGVALDIIDLLGDFCAGGIGLVTSWPAALERIRQFIEQIFHLF